MAEGQTHKPEEISETDLRKVHTERYLDSLKVSRIPFNAELIDFNCFQTLTFKLSTVKII